MGVVVRRPHKVTREIGEIASATQVYCLQNKTRGSRDKRCPQLVFRTTSLTALRPALRWSGRQSSKAPWRIPFKYNGSFYLLRVVIYLIIQRPSVPINLQNVCLARLLASLRPKRPRIGSCRADQVTDGPLPANATRPVSTSSDDNLVVGINQVTRTLECQIQSLRTLAVLPNSGSPPESLAAVFVCSADIDPPILVEHIPHLVASCNSFHHIVKQEPSKVKLVPLPKGSEQAVAQAVGIRRAAVIGVPVRSLLLCNHAINPLYREIVPSLHPSRMY